MTEIFEIASYSDLLGVLGVCIPFGFVAGSIFAIIAYVIDGLLTIFHR